MASPALVPDPAYLHLLSLATKGQTILIEVVTRAPEAICPLCHHPSERVHSRYQRRVADLPWANLAVQVCLHVRRFFCDNRACPRLIFTERLPTVVAPYGRKTRRLVEVLTSLAFALGGEAGQRMSQHLGLATSAATLLHQIRATPSPTRCATSRTSSNEPAPDHPSWSLGLLRSIRGISAPLPTVSPFRVLSKLDPC